MKMHELEDEQLEDEQLEDEQLEEQELDDELEQEELQTVAVNCQFVPVKPASITFETPLITITSASKSSFLIRLSSPRLMPLYVLVGSFKHGTPLAVELFAYCTVKVPCFKNQEMKLENERSPFAVTFVPKSVTLQAVLMFCWRYVKTEDDETTAGLALLVRLEVIVTALYIVWSLPGAVLPLLLHFPCERCVLDELLEK